MSAHIDPWGVAPYDEPPPPPDEPPDPGEGTSPPVARSFTDDGNALRLVDAESSNFRYVPERGDWLAWDDYRWTWDTAGRIHEAARHVIRSLGSGEALSKHKTRSLARRGIEAMVAMARTDPRVVVPANQLDADPYALCTPQGVVDLRTGEVHRPSPDQLHTRAALVAPDPDMATPCWDAFLAQTFAGHDELMPYIQRLAGYSITGTVTHHVLPFLHGKGGNGKTVFLDVIRAVLGDYATSAPAGFLMAGREQHETEIARLHGLRFVICSEVNQEARFDEAKVKILTGGDHLTARFMHRDHFDFDPTHHLWLMGNHKPAVGAGGESFWRRLRMIPFDNTVPTDQVDEDLTRRLVDDEGPGILAWLVAGAVATVPGQSGLLDPASVLTETRTYALEEDAVGRFLTDRCHLGGAPQVRADTKAVLDAYREWCRDEGIRPVNNTVFGRELKTRFDIDSTRSNSRRYYAGVTVLTPDDTPWPDEPPVTDPYDDDPGAWYR